jgi:hypothetical protein
VSTCQRYLAADIYHASSKTDGTLAFADINPSVALLTGQ